MIYQKLLTGKKPYKLCSIDYKEYALHFHYEIEIIYCKRGHFEISCDNVPYRLQEGDALLIDSMIPHTYKDKDDKNRSLLIEIGPSLMRENFKHIAKHPFISRLILKNKMTETMKSCLEELYTHQQNKTELSDIIILSNIYRLFAEIVKEASQNKNASAKNSRSKIKHTKKIDNAIELVHQRYSEPLSVEDAAAACGYGKSSFCKMFKSSVGSTFHKYLNDYRIESSKHLLLETHASIEEIAEATGFHDTKIFCRVFKESTGITPGKYRIKKK